MITPLRAHDRDDVLAGHHRAAQVDRADAVERRLGDLLGRRVAAGDAHPHIVVQDVDAAEAAARFRHGGGERRLPGDVGLPGHAFAGAALLRDHGRGLRGGCKAVVDREHPRAFLGEAQHGGAAIAHALAGRLPGADDNSGFALETHHERQREEWLASRSCSAAKAGAGEGNRTLVCSLGSCRSTIELRPQSLFLKF
jgi:hypothetical protein